MTNATNDQSPRFVSRVCRAVNAQRAALTGIFAVAVMHTAVFAQDTTALRPPKVTDAPSSPKVMVYLVLLLLTALLVFATIMKCKRTHQD